MQLGPVPTVLAPLLTFFFLWLKDVLVSATFHTGAQLETLLQSTDLLLVSGSDATLGKVLACVTVVPTLCIPSHPGDCHS